MEEYEGTSFILRTLVSISNLNGKYSAIKWVKLDGLVENKQSLLDQFPTIGGRIFLY
jgi:hypothetical protein